LIDIGLRLRFSLDNEILFWTVSSRWIGIRTLDVLRELILVNQLMSKVFMVLSSCKSEYAHSTEYGFYIFNRINTFFTGRGFAFTQISW